MSPERAKRKPIEFEKSFSVVTTALKEKLRRSRKDQVIVESFEDRAFVFRRSGEFYLDLNGRMVVIPQNPLSALAGYATIKYPTQFLEGIEGETKADTNFQIQAVASGSSINNEGLQRELIERLHVTLRKVTRTARRLR